MSNFSSMISMSQLGRIAVFWKFTLFIAVFVCAVFLGLVSVVFGDQDYFFSLVACVFFVAGIAFLFTVVQAARGREWALILFLVISCFLIDATFRQREITAQTIDGQTLIKLVVWGCSILIAFMATPSFFSRLFCGDMKWISIIAFYALFGTFYSITPAYTFGGGFAAIAYCSLAVCVAENLRKEMILRGLLAGLSLLLAVSLLMYSAGMGMNVMEGGHVLRLGGLTGSPNTLGRAASLTLLLIGVLVIYGDLSLWNWRALVPVLMAMVCLILADSRTSLAVVLSSFSIYFFRKHPAVALIGCFLFGFAVLLVLNLDISFHDLGALLSRTGRSTDLTTLTGRTDIWMASIDAFFKRPFFGYGFGSTKILLPEIYRTYWGFTVTQAHNLYIQTAVTLGVFGLVLVLIIIFRQMLSYVKRQDVFKTVVLGFILVHGLTEPGPIGVSPNIVTFFWALSLCWDRVLERELCSPNNINSARSNPA